MEYDTLGFCCEVKHSYLDNIYLIMFYFSNMVGAVWHSGKRFGLNCAEFVHKL